MDATLVLVLEVVLIGLTGLVMLFVATLGALMCLFLLMSLMAHVPTRNFFLIYLGLGFLVYFAYGLWNSKLAKGEVIRGHEQPNPVQPGS